MSILAMTVGGGKRSRHEKDAISGGFRQIKNRC
jgi:hypothetical protein